ncbi:SRPBCC family protein [Brevundimonas sp.]|uniref:SRPBCC family protein n=1 Tax=Brevundimonas sp. TaxID=1871086 RepID=UPI002FCAF62D
MTAPVASAGMLIRRPVGEVFKAFADPAITSRFWFTRSSGRLETGARVRWEWEMYGVGTDVTVKAIEPGRRILIDWDTADTPTEVEWLFEARGDAAFVAVENRGFDDSPEGRAKALDSTGGFNLVLAAAKFWLEHGIDPRIIEDAHPAGRRPEWKGRA